MFKLSLRRFQYGCQALARKTHQEIPGIHDKPFCPAVINRISIPHSSIQIAMVLQGTNGIHNNQGNDVASAIAAIGRPNSVLHYCIDVSPSRIVRLAVMLN